MVEFIIKSLDRSTIHKQNIPKYGVKTSEKNVSASISHRPPCSCFCTFANSTPQSQHSIFSMNKCNFETTRANFTGYKLLPSCDHVAPHEHDICHLNSWNRRGGDIWNQNPKDGKNQQLIGRQPIFTPQDMWRKTYFSMLDLCCAMATPANTKEKWSYTLPFWESLWRPIRDDT